MAENKMSPCSGNAKSCEEAFSSRRNPAEQEITAAPLAWPITLEGFAFAVFADSCDVACKALDHLVMAAVKANGSLDWKDEICKHFSSAIGPHLRARLDSRCPNTDVYVVCKVLRCHMRDVFAYCGQRQADHDKKERLSLQMQGVEAARNWAFHGESVSPLEVCSTIQLLTEVLIFLQREYLDIAALQLQMGKLKRALREEPIAHASTGGTPTRFQLSVRTVWRTTVYQSLQDFEKRFSEHFGVYRNDNQQIMMDSQNHEKAEDVLHQIIKLLQKELCKPKKDRTFQTIPTSESKTSRPLIKRCQNVLPTRNKLAHNASFSHEEVVCLLDDVCHLLGAFGLCCEVSKAALKDFKSLVNKDDIVDCVIAKTSPTPRQMLRKRILRPKARDFVGRESERKTLLQALTDLQSKSSVCVLLSGAAGAGKSFLASKTAHDLRNTYPCQKWIDCSATEGLSRRLSKPTSYFPDDDIEPSPTAYSHELSLNHQFTSKEVSSQGTATASVEGNPWLLVLDNVRPCTADWALNELLQASNSVIITTKSTAVQEHLKREVPSLLVCALQPFSEAETIQLLKLKTKAKLKKQSLAWAATTAQFWLGNLPLCVSIFSAFLAAKKTSNETSAGGPEVCDTTSLLSNWKKFEDGFGDSFHVRGLCGILEMAQEFLEDRPLLLFTLAKICQADNRIIPWSLIANCSSWLIEATSFATTKPASSLLSNFLEVLHTLFSPEAERTLNHCRDMLEDLGLIAWEKETASISIHSITLCGVKRMLTKKCIFLDKILDLLHTANCQLADGRERHTADSKYLFRTINSVLLYQILSTGIDKLKIAFSEDSLAESGLNFEEAFKIYRVISELTERAACQDSHCRLTAPGSSIEEQQKDLQKAWAIVAFHLSEFEDRADIRCLGAVRSKRRAYGLLCSRFELQHQTVNRFEAFLPKIVEWIFGDCPLLSPPEDGRQRSQYMKALEVCEWQSSYERFGRSLLANTTHSEPTRQNHVNEALMAALLSSRYRPNSLHRESDFLYRLHSESKKGNWQDIGLLRATHIKFRVSATTYMLGKRLSENLRNFGSIDGVTTESARMMIAVLQIRQQLYSRDWRCCNSSKVSGLFVQLNIWFDFALDVKNENFLWRMWKRSGMAIRALVKFIRLSILELDLPAFLLDRVFITTPELLTIIQTRFGQIFAILCDAAKSIGHCKASQDALEFVIEASESRHHQSSEYIFQLDEGGFENLPRLPFSQRCSVIQETADKESLEWKIVLLKSRARFLLYNFDFRESFRAYIAYWDACGRLSKLEGCSGTPSIAPDALIVPFLYNLLDSEEAKEQLKRCSPPLHMLPKDPVPSEAQDVLVVFEKVNEAFLETDFESSRLRALRCWKQIDFLLRSSSIPEDSNAREELLNFFLHVRLRLCDYLWKSYAHDGQHDHANWFCVYALQASEQSGQEFAFAKCQASNIRFLLNSEQLPEALTQARELQSFLTKHFGEDYREWMSDAPHAVDFCRQVEAEIAKLHL